MAALNGARTTLPLPGWSYRLPLSHAHITSPLACPTLTALPSRAAYLPDLSLAAAIEGTGTTSCLRAGGSCHGHFAHVILAARHRGRGGRRFFRTLLPNWRYGLDIHTALPPPLLPPGIRLTPHKTRACNDLMQRMRRGEHVSAAAAAGFGSTGERREEERREERERREKEERERELGSWDLPHHRADAGLAFVNAIGRLPITVTMFCSGIRCWFDLHRARAGIAYGPPTVCWRLLLCATTTISNGRAPQAGLLA